MNESIPCTEDCIPFNCECPYGLVLDEENNECVIASECRSRIFGKYIVEKHTVILQEIYVCNRSLI